MPQTSKHSSIACALLAVPALALVCLGCGREVEGSTASTKETVAALDSAGAELLVPWGTGGLGFDRGGHETHARGPESFTFDGTGRGFLVLDSLGSRIVRVGSNGGVVQPVVVGLPKDADGIAVSPKGEVAVHRALDLHVSVYDARGRLSGQVAVPEGAREANIVHLLSQGRVMLEHPYQERYLLGSPNVPRQPDVILPTRREGVGDGFDAVGYQILVKVPVGASVSSETHLAVARLGAGPAPAGSHAYLVARFPEGPPEHGALRYGTRDVADLGEATSGRIFGVRGDSVCSVLEHVDLDATVVDVAREVVCIAIAQRKEITRFAIDTSPVYTPQQDLVFDGKRVACATPTDAGLRIRTVVIAEGSK